MKHLEGWGGCIAKPREVMFSFLFNQKYSCRESMISADSSGVASIFSDLWVAGQAQGVEINCVNYKVFIGYWFYIARVIETIHGRE